VSFKINHNTVKLLRIPFSFFLMPIFLLTLSQTENLILSNAIGAFLIIHFLVYPASNGYNSYIDRDETPIGGLEHPPMPTKTLFHLTLLMDFLAILLSFLLINPLFSLCIFTYILASRAYSAKQIRLKKYPLLGFLIVTVFQGAFTYYMCSVGITNSKPELTITRTFLMLASSFQIAGAYPLTQIYQHKADINSGIITISYKLGYKGTFIFTAFMFLTCNIFYYLYFSGIEKINQFYYLQLFFLPVIIFFSYWFFKVINDQAEANFKNTMRMNSIAAISMNSCFLFLLLLNS